MRRLCATICAAAAAVIPVALSAAPAQASGWVYPQTYWTASSENLHVWGEAYAHDYACGLKDCANASHLYFQAGRLSGTSYSNATRVSAATKFGGVGISVSVSYPAGVSAGFTDGGSSCDHGWWNGNATWVSVDFGSSTICQADTWGWVSNMSEAVTGGARFGGSWSVRSASDNISLGGL